MFMPSHFNLHLPLTRTLSLRWVLLWQAPRHTFAAGGVLRKGYIFASAYLAFMLITYPICWALSEGANVISPSSEMIWYGILDIFAGPFFLFFFLWELRGVDYHVFGLHSGKYTDIHSNPGHVEKAAAPVNT